MSELPTFATILIEQGPVYFALVLMVAVLGVVAWGGARVLVPLGTSMRRFADEQQELRKEQKEFYKEITTSLERRVEGLEESLIAARKEREASDEANMQRIANLTRTVEEQAREIAALRKERDQQRRLIETEQEKRRELQEQLRAEIAQRGKLEVQVAEQDKKLTEQAAKIGSLETKNTQLTKELEAKQTGAKK
jgi:chromosome segregation ATPase